MNCENCNFEVPESSKFCPRCGEKIEIKNTKKEKIGESILSEISNHLGFLGYDTEIVKAENDKGRDFIIAKHSQRNNIIIFNSFQHIQIFQVNLTTNKKWNEAMGAYINSANKIMTCAKVYYEIEDNAVMLKFEAAYTGKYVKDVFGFFLDMFIKDVEVLFGAGDNFNELFIK